MKCFLTSSEMSGDPEVSLTNKRMAGIWLEANSLRSLILRKDTRAADKKYSDKFTEEDIRLCLETGFLYPLEKNFYDRWSYTVAYKKKVSKPFILFGKTLGEMQILPKDRVYRVGFDKVNLLNFTKLFGWPQTRHDTKRYEVKLPLEIRRDKGEYLFWIGSKVRKVSKRWERDNF
ncbi:hypothetical protein GMAR_ORF107 [Golden Marseillevirus]|uniref:hypothetical protein n=1 Tax=Golden Marseillevirus TaxID=1720526 RepID=UPI000877AB87|nr:hypothetical protein GMAR_ORF107 [Golden Marseillevirus]ALX27481.1 hypothetical protein GMAR_ORF107 [Golden Marseillevirus]